MPETLPATVHPSSHPLVAHKLSLLRDRATEPKTFREKVEGISDNPACASCHMTMDPLGLALENYDGIGRFRTTYPDGVPVDPNVVLFDGTAVSGLPGVIEWVTNNSLYQSCLVRKLYTYGLGRRPGEFGLIGHH